MRLQNEEDRVRAVLSDVGKLKESQHAKLTGRGNLACGIDRYVTEENYGADN
ncbi:MAG: hypothetical protein ACLUGQ_08645 [Coprococcus sp.]